MKQEAKYKQLVNQLKMDIQTGIYPVGSTIPSQVQLGDMFDVSQITIRKAVGLLELEGYIRKGNGRGKGSVVLERTEEHTKQRIGYNFGIIGRSRILNLHSHDMPAVAEGMIPELSKWHANISVLPFLTEEHPSAMSFVHSVLEKNLVDGFFVFEYYDAQELCDFFAASNIPFVRVITYCLGLDEMKQSPFPMVAIEERDQLKKMLINAVKQGRDKVCLIAAVEDLMPVRTHDLLEGIAADMKLEYNMVEATKLSFTELCQILCDCAQKDMLTVSSTPLLQKLDIAMSLMPEKKVSNLELVIYKHYGGELSEMMFDHAMIERPFKQLGFEAAKMMKSIVELKSEGKQFCDNQHVILQQYLTHKRSM